MLIVRFAVYLIVLACTLLPALYINNVQAYLPLIFLVLISVCSLGYGLLLLGSFSLGQSYGSNVHTRGIKTKIGAEVKNRGILIFPRISAIFSVKGPYGYEKRIVPNITLSPREQSKIGLELAFPHIEKYTVRINSIRIYGLLGILGLIYRKSIQREITVMPQLVDIDFDIVSQRQYEGMVLSNVKRLTDNSSYNGVRDYVAGDPLKRIHWKLTAHEQKHKTRLFDDDNITTLTVFIDATTPASKGEKLADTYDCLLESSLSIIANSLSNNNKTLIVYRKDGDLDRLSPLTSDYAAQELVSRIEFGENNGIADSLLGQIPVGLLVVCTGILSEDIVHNLVYLKSGGKNPILVYCIPPDRDEYGDRAMLEMLDASEIEHYVVRSAQELKNKMEEER